MEDRDLEYLSSPAVMKHLDILQGIITRMAGNSASCKTWAVTLVSALLALSIENCRVPIWICFVPVVMLYLLDSFYLGLERHFIGLQRGFLQKLHKKELHIEDIYSIKSKRSFLIHLGFMWGGLFSFATSFFYLPVIGLILALIILGG